MIDTIEKFQGDLGKKILNIPKHHSNLIPLDALTMRLRRKFGFLWCILHPRKGSIYVFESLQDREIEPLIVQQCIFLEKVYSTYFTDAILSHCGVDVECPLTLKAVKKRWKKKTVTKFLSRCPLGRASLPCQLAKALG